MFSLLNLLSGVRVWGRSRRCVIVGVIEMANEAMDTTVHQFVNLSNEPQYNVTLGLQIGSIYFLQECTVALVHTALQRKP